MRQDELLIHRELEYLRAAAAASPKAHVSRTVLGERKQRAEERWAKLLRARSQARRWT